MNSGLLGALAAIGVGLLTLAGAVYTTRSGGRVSPYDSLAKRVTDLEDQHDEDRTLIHELRDKDEASQTKIAGLERKVAAVITDRDDVVGFLVVWREWVAKGSVPPAPRIPLHLRDVIPDWTPQDADRDQDDELAAERAAGHPPQPYPTHPPRTPFGP